MPRACEVLRAAALTTMLAVTVSCSTTKEPGDELEALPADAIGAVSIGPELLEAVDDQDRTTVYAFDESGSVLGQVEGNAIYGNNILTAAHKLVSASSRAVITLTDTARIETPIDYENIVQAAVNQQETGAATIWFNSGAAEGHYSNSFVSIDADNQAHSGSVPGIVRTSAYCDGRNFTVVNESFIGTTGDPTRNQLYELLPSGEPIVRAEWEHPSDFRPADVGSACSSDGQTILALYSSRETRKNERGDQGLTLVRINVSDGSRSETALDMPGYIWNVRRGTPTAIDDRLYWISGDGDVLSVDVTGSSKVTREWTIPEGDAKTAVSVSGRTVTTVNYRGTPIFSEYDLLTGERRRSQIELPWLESIVGSETESGKNIYTISDVASLTQ